MMFYCYIQDGNTALMYACSRLAMINIVELLLDKNADINMKNNVCINFIYNNITQFTILYMVHIYK